jgi:hypothetical protein
MKDEYRIADIQKEIKDLGWQWIEHIYNDGYEDCFLKLHDSKNPCVFSDITKDEIGWGRFNRKYCWEQALMCIKSQLTKKDDDNDRTNLKERDGAIEAVTRHPRLDA